MTTETKAIAPEQAGLSLAILSGPRGEVREDWPCIAYTCHLSDSRRRVIWTGEFRLGVGHVKWPKGNEVYPEGITQDEMYCLNTIRMKPGAQIKDKQLWANTAAKLAEAQKVTPSLNDVCHSLLSDGSAFFDGQRFEEWAGDLGYSDDSIKAKEIFETCDRIGRDLSRALSRDEIAGLREWASQY
jgi:hypothetical protein